MSWDPNHGLSPIDPKLWGIQEKGPNHLLTFARLEGSHTGRYYTKTQEWFEVQEPGIGTVGITQRAQRVLGEVVYCRLPQEGETFQVMQTLVTLEALKSVGEVKSPITGEVVEVNPRLQAEPGLVTRLPLRDGWLVRLAYSGPLPRYLRGSKAISRDEVQKLLADRASLQQFILRRMGEADTDDALNELTFDGLTSFERRWVHHAAEGLGFTTESKGSGQGRRLILRRPAQEPEGHGAGSEDEAEA
eukprot:929538-Amphidinium_carterae.1